MAGSRYSIIPADALLDDRMGDLHIRVLALLGTYSDNNGWLMVNQKTLAEKARKARETINRIIADLVEFGYLRKQARLGEDGRRLINEYQVLMDRPKREPVTETAPETNDHVTPASHAPCDPTVTGYVTSEDHIPCDLQTSQHNDPFFKRPLSPKGDGRAVARKPSTSKKRDRGRAREPSYADHLEELLRT